MKLYWVEALSVNMTYEEKLTKVKARLMLAHPYFGTITSTLKLEKNNEILTFSSDGETMHYNTEYMDRLTLDEVEFVLANAAMHTVLQHQDRVGERTKWLWQTATDYVINAMLVKNGMSLPQYAYYEDKFVGMYAEEVYDILRAEMLNNSDYSMEKESQQITQSDDVHDENISMHEASIPDKQSTNILPEETHANQKDRQEQLENIFQKLQRQGTLPKELHFVVPEYFSHTIDWREWLYGAIASHAKISYSFNPPNKKYLYRGIYLPSMYADLLRIVIAIDISGSIDENLLSVFLAEVHSIMQQYPNYEIDLITADTKIQSHDIYVPGEVFNYQVSGGGGTDFRPVFEYIEQHIDYPTMLLYFTDGDGIFPKEYNGYDTLWIMPHKIEVPFGEVVHIEI